MSGVKSKYTIVEAHSAEARLTALGLSKDGILTIRDVAHGYRLDAGPLMAANAPGSLAYHFGVESMRQQYIGSIWRLDRDGGLEGIVNVNTGVKVCFQNIDVACDPLTEPKPISEKGAGAERACQGNLFAKAGISVPPKPTPIGARSAIYFVMVDQKGGVEVSRPIVAEKKFIDFVERIFVSDGSDFGKIELDETPPPPADDFDVTISRR